MSETRVTDSYYCDSLVQIGTRRVPGSGPSIELSPLLNVRQHRLFLYYQKRLKAKLKMLAKLESHSPRCPSGEVYASVLQHDWHPCQSDPA
jgi:hypothetical protein